MMRDGRDQIIRWGFACLLAVLLCVPAYGQADDEDVFASVPTTLRARLVERLKLLIEYQRAQQWQKQYDLLSVAATQGDSREEHIARLNRVYAEGLGDILIDFTPRAVTYGSGAPFDAAIFGCVKLREKGRIVELHGSVEAYRENDDWFFSPIGVVTPVDGKPQPCPYSKQSTAARPSSRCSVANGRTNNSCYAEQKSLINLTDEQVHARHLHGLPDLFVRSSLRDRTGPPALERDQS